MKKIKNYFLVLFLKFLPIGRCYRLVSRIHNIRGYKVHENARIFSSVKIYGNIGLNISDGTYIGNETIITGGLANISIGENCDISDRVSIFCGSHEIDVRGVRSAGKGIGKDINIGNGVWIGYGALILPGVTIGDKSIIAAGSVVNKNVADKTIVGGNPIREIKKIYE
tara:strand:- start:646 stop:1149 length:504 start_codon:yes stop_codon:yes gene_type:complete